MCRDMNPIIIFNVPHEGPYPFIQSDSILNFLKSDIKHFTPFVLPQNKEKTPQTSDTASIFDIYSRLPNSMQLTCVHQPKLPNLGITRHKQAHSSPL